MRRMLLQWVMGLWCCWAVGPARCPGAEIRTITPQSLAEGLAPAGKEADWIIGDHVMRNERIVAVIAADRPGRHANMTVKDVGGCLIDLTTRAQENDQLSCFYPGGGGITYHFAGITAEGGSQSNSQVQDVDGEKTITAAGSLVSLRFEATIGEKAAAVALTYTLRDGDDAIEITSVYSNPHPVAIELTPQDTVRADRTFTSGLDAGRGVVWWDDEWFRQTYAVQTVGGAIWDDPALQGKPRPTRTPVVYRSGAQAKRKLEPGESLSVTRRLLPADHLLAARGKAAQHGGEATRQITIRVVDPRGGVPGGIVQLFAGDTRYGGGRVDEQGRLTCELPAAVHDVRIVASGMGRGSVEIPLALDDGRTAAGEVTINLPEPGWVEATITDDRGGPIPCKIQFRPRSDPAAGDPKAIFQDPDFGPDSGDTAVRNLVYTHDGHCRQALTPGDYDALVSYGPEYDIDVRLITVTRGQVTPLQVRLSRVVDTRGWVSSDFHSHASPSGDNTTSQLGRVQNLLAEHIEFAPCTEHNRISSYTAHLERLRAAHLLATCSGMELTGSLLPVNHQNAFPLVEHRHHQDGGGPQVDHDNPLAQIERLALWDGGSEKLMQMNHPHLPRVLGDRDGDGSGDGGFESMLGFVDVVEVHPPASIFTKPASLEEARAKPNTIFNWLQMLNLGYRITGVVNTDAHYTFHGSGWLRNYIASSTDDPARIDTMEMVRNAAHGRLVMTNGPFLTVVATAGKTVTAGPGDDLVCGDDTVMLDIRVQCPNWLDVDRVQVFVNGLPDPRFNFTRRQHGSLFSRDVVRFQHAFPVPLTTDAHLVVAAIGEDSTLGLIMGPEHAERQPVAVANPIFVDVDGEGFRANGDLLGIPLPHQNKPSRRHRHPHASP